MQLYHLFLYLRGLFGKSLYDTQYTQLPLLGDVQAIELNLIIRMMTLDSSYTSNSSEDLRASDKTKENQIKRNDTYKSLVTKPSHGNSSYR